MSAPSPSSPTLLARLGLHRPELRAWAMYDWANSAMVTVIITAVFPPFFASVVSRGLSAAESSARFSAVTFVSMFATAIASPILGAIADARPLKKPLLGLFVALGAAAVAGMFFLGPGDWLLACVLFGLANFGANCSFVFYDALLPHVAHEEEIDRVSSAGYALGYIGGAVLLTLNLAWILKPALFGLPEGTLPVRLAFLSVAVWWVGFSLPLFRRVAEPVIAVRRAVSFAAVVGDLGNTLRALVQLRQATFMLLAFLLYNDGIGTIFRMATLYGTELGLSQSDLIIAILGTQVIGVPASFAFGALASRFGSKRLIFVGLVVYVGISALGFAMTQAWHFFVLAGLVGLVQGGTQALSRSLFASLIPKQRSAEFFGFFAVTEKFAGIFGPGIFALSAWLTGSSRSAILSVVFFFAAGGALLWKVRVEEGQAQAREAERLGAAH